MARKHDFVVKNVWVYYNCPKCGEKRILLKEFHTSDLELYNELMKTRTYHKNGLCYDCSQGDKSVNKIKGIVYLIIIAFVVLGILGSFVVPKLFGKLFGGNLGSAEKTASTYSQIVKDWEEQPSETVTVDDAKKDVIYAFNTAYEYYCYIYQSETSQIQKFDRDEYYFELKGEEYGEFAGKQWYMTRDEIVDVTNGVCWPNTHKEYGSLRSSLEGFIPETIISKSAFSAATRKKHTEIYDAKAYLLEGENLKLVSANKSVIQIGDSLTFNANLMKATSKIFEKPIIPDLKQAD